jgi:hypothetical protein
MIERVSEEISSANVVNFFWLARTSGTTILVLAEMEKGGT